MHGYWEPDMDPHLFCVKEGVGILEVMGQLVGVRSSTVWVPGIELRLRGFASVFAPSHLTGSCSLGELGRYILIF